MIQYVVLRVADARTVLPEGHRMLALADWYNWGGDVPLQWVADSLEGREVTRLCEELGIFFETRDVQIGSGVVR